MATFTDLSLSTQAGDPVVSTLTAGLDRNLIAAFEGDPTATSFIQAQNASMTDGCVTFAKQGDFQSSATASTPLSSEKLYGTWGGYGSGGFQLPGYIQTFIQKSGKYRIVAELEVTSNPVGGNPHPSGGAIGNGKCELRKNVTTFTGSLSGTVIATSPTLQSLNTRTIIDVTHDLVAGENLVLFLSGYSHQYNPATQFNMHLKLFCDASNLEGVSSVGLQYLRYQPVGPIFAWAQSAELGHIDWLSTPYGGDIS